jgi:hypothetical protein
MDRPGEIDAIRRNIFTAERHVERQRRSVARLRTSGENAALAEHILGVFETSLAEHRRQLAEAQQELSLATV